MLPAISRAILWHWAQQVANLALNFASVLNADLKRKSRLVAIEYTTEYTRPAHETSVITSSIQISDLWNRFAQADSFPAPLCPICNSGAVVQTVT